MEYSCFINSNGYHTINFWSLLFLIKNSLYPQSSIISVKCMDINFCFGYYTCSEASSLCLRYPIHSYDSFCSCLPGLAVFLETKCNLSLIYTNSCMYPGLFFLLCPNPVWIFKDSAALTQSHAVRALTTLWSGLVSPSYHFWGSLFR